METAITVLSILAAITFYLLYLKEKKTINDLCDFIELYEDCLDEIYDENEDKQDDIDRLQDIIYDLEDEIQRLQDPALKINISCEQLLNIKNKFN